MDSLSRVEDGVRRMQTWGYVEEKGAPKVYPHWTEWEDPDAKYVRDRVESRMRADMKRSVGKEGSLMREDLMERGEQQRDKVKKQLNDRANAATIRNRFRPAQMGINFPNAVTTDQTPAISLLAQVDKAHLTSEHSPVVSSPLRESVVAVEPGLLDGGNKTPRAAPPLKFDFSIAHTVKPTVPHSIAIADPSNNYHPQLVSHPSQTNDDNEAYEIDQLMEDTDSDSDYDQHDVSMNGQECPPPTTYDHDLYLNEPTRNPPQPQKRKVETRGHMVLRNGKVTGFSRDITPPPFSPTLPAQPPILGEDVPAICLTPTSPSVTTIPQTTVSSVPSLSTVTTGPPIPTPLTQTALSFHTAVTAIGEGLPGAAVDTPISTTTAFPSKLPTPPPDRPLSFFIKLPPATQSRPFLANYREPMAVDSSTSTSSDDSSNDVQRSPSPSPSSTAATHGSSPSQSLHHQVDECYIKTRPATPNPVVERKEKFREQLEAARTYNPIQEEP
ncbi:hypothetical protein BDY19DRAFT_999086, partial [Irpex rosettiformis]